MMHQNVARAYKEDCALFHAKYIYIYIYLSFCFVVRRKHFSTYTETVGRIMSKVFPKIHCWIDIILMEL